MQIEGSFLLKQLPIDEESDAFKAIKKAANLYNLEMLLPCD